MGNVGNKIAAQILQSPQSGNVMYNYECADLLAVRPAQRRAMSLQVTFFALMRQCQLGLNGIVAGQGLCNKAVQFNFACHLADASSPCNGRVYVKQFTRSAVDLQNHLICIYRDNSFDHTGQNRFLLIALLNDSAQPFIKLGRHTVHRLGQTVYLGN